MDETWLPYLYWMDTIFESGRRINRMLLDLCHSPIAVYNIEETRIRSILNAKQAERFLQAQKRTDREIHDVYQCMLKQNIAFIPFMHPLFPEKLKGIPDAPFGIYVAGSLPEQKRPSVAIIGARVCSEYGKYMARNLADKFAKLDIAVISGMAKGIDGIGQRAVLEAGGKTYGVLGCGVDVCYPSENRDIYNMLWEHGGLISEYPPGTQPFSYQFPPRNRIISALADAIIVIEAKRKSGTMITVDMALEQGKEVYALPGRCTDLLSEGCNLLIRQGAGVVISAEEIAEDLHRLNTKNPFQKSAVKIHKSKMAKIECKQMDLKMMTNSTDYPITDSAPHVTIHPDMSPVQQQIFECMELEIRTIDEIMERFRNRYPDKKLSVIDMMCELMTLQMLGYVQKTNGGFLRKG